MGSIKKAFDLTGKNALVTGGSRGLGLQIAEAPGEFHRLGFSKLYCAATRKLVVSPVPKIVLSPIPK